MRRWRRRTLITEGVLLVGAVAGFMTWSLQSNHWQGMTYRAEWLELVKTIPWGLASLEGALLALVILAHFIVRHLTALSLMHWLRKRVEKSNPPGNVIAAFKSNTRFWRPMILGRPFGWGRKTRTELDEVLQSCESYIQTLNERFTNPNRVKG
jgi:hypothetical protein